MKQTGFAAIERALRCTDPVDKCRQVKALQGLARIEASVVEVMTGGLDPGRPPLPRLVAPREVPRRRLNTAAGRAALIHAVAHIEFNAINLALDAAWRFRGLPADYYRDWLAVAADEARHFGWLNARLAELGHGYGDFDAHNGLWEMACQTAHDPLPRMALVPRVLEARGLDVTPGMIRRLQSAGDENTAAILLRIFEEEQGHVAIGSRWYRYLCERRGVDADTLFPQLVRDYMQASLRGPFNLDARRAGGFSRHELAWLASLG